MNRPALLPQTVAALLLATLFLISTTATADEALSMQVQVVHGAQAEADLGSLPVLLHAVRPRGPFQTNHIAPVATFHSTTNAQGLAHFDAIPADLVQRGLRFEASTSFGGLSFDSSSYNAADGLLLTLPVYDHRQDLSGLRVAQKRVVVEPWEEYMIVSQFWTFILEADHAVDLNLATDPELARGLPLRLPIAAEGIHFSGPGSAEVVNNLIFWNGVLQPNRPITFQIRFSQPARSSSWTFEQVMQYPTDEVQIIAPVQTQYQKIPRLNELALLAPGFDVNADPGAIGLRTDTEFLLATGRSLQAGESYTFRIEGLPFRRPIGGWIALFGGILGALFVLGYGRREYKFLHDEQGRSQVLASLYAQRDLLLDEIAKLRRHILVIDDEELSYPLEEEESLLRERLALILRKIRDIESASSPA